MDEDKLNQSGKAWCCYIEPETRLECKNDAEWLIFEGPGSEDYTHACTEHIGALLTDAPVHQIYPLQGH